MTVKTQISKHDFDPLAYFPFSQFGAVLGFSPILLGMSGARVYSVSTEAGDFILRLDRAGAERAGLVSHQRHAAAHGIAPNIIWYDEIAIISTKVNGMSLGQAVSNPSSRDAAIVSLVNQIAKLHAIHCDGLVEVDLGAKAFKLFAAQSARPGFPNWALPLSDRLTRARDELANDKRFVFSHCDLNPGNMIWDGNKVWLVDWEQANLSHPYLDLATVGMFLSFSDEEALALLAVQEKAVIGEEEWRIFLAVRDLARMSFASIFFQLIPDLATVPFATLEATLTIKECFGRLSRGHLDLGRPEGRALIGAACLKPCVKA
ncbi:MAG TPA: phosphotransferase [Oligoflexus sp.]|uniref:phosphotransferase n=1 Tax=Oligoflexus sp. TaxID=1971216 RepID=UPI002D720EA0|nr:phosphotransferase [Oligoflexus sp.]HYX37507.1 phosphotransferase [Oligoflexus sp.]